MGGRVLPALRAARLMRTFRAIAEWYCHALVFSFWVIVLYAVLDLLGLVPSL